jgi:D-beta-D-heptose 7-phosphate kinase / D-beta-D-heptose 1-phosphate adenosyltransferase
MTLTNDLVAAVARLPKARVAVAGDVMLDRFVYGSVERVSPEAPIPVLRLEREIAMAGGAGNVARNIAALGAQVALAGIVGQDKEADELRAALGAQMGPALTLVREPGRRTTVKTRYIAGAQQLLRADREDVQTPKPATQAALHRAVQASLADADLLVLSDYGKGALAGVADLIDAARAAELPVLVDPKGRDYGIYRGSDVITPNQRELAAATGMPAETDAQVVAAAEFLIREYGFRAVVATRGAAGMSVIESDRAPRHLPAQASEVFDVSGAGDTVIATLAAAIASGVPLPIAAALANLAAGIVVGKIGTAVVRGEEILAALHANELHAGEAKIVGLARAVDLIERWRARGLKIGFTNGCFDLLHPGHISLLTQARAACDKLVVGLNTDESVRRLKGAGRPIQPESARAIVLASLGSVDLVVPFAEDTPIELIRAIRPELLVKGADYTVATVVGADIVTSYGGKVLLADLIAGQSTTATLARLKSR